MAATIVYGGVTNSITGAATTFDHQNVSIEAGDWLGIAIQGTQQGATAQSISALTINGTPVTPEWSQVQVGGTDTNGNRAIAALALVEHPGGATVDIGVTWAATMFDDVVSPFSLTGIDPTPFVTPVTASLSGNQTTADLSQNFAEGGVGFAACTAYQFDLDPGTTWTGYSKEFDHVNFSPGNHYSIASYTAVVAQTPLTGSCNFAEGTGATGSVAGIAVSFAEPGADNDFQPAWALQANPILGNGAVV